MRRTGQEMRGEERKEKTWYIGKTNGNTTNEFPIFCPATPKSTLAAKWKKIATEITEQSNGLVEPKIVQQGV